MIDIGKQIKNLRKEKNYSAAELSDRSGVARSLISQLETGKRQSANIDTLDRLAKALDVSLSHFVSEEPSANHLASYKQPHPSTFIINEESLPYLNTIQKAQKAGLTPELFDELLDLIVRMRESSK